MTKTTDMLLESLKNYSNPKTKLSRMVEKHEYYPIIRGLYETDKSVPPYLLAGSICSPSYISFSFALSVYGLIPEAVPTATSATFEKRKKKLYTTPFGNFIYRDIPSSAFPYGIRVVREGDYYYRIAEPEKALCDLLYTLSPVHNMKELDDLLFENLRIERDDISRLDWDKVAAYAPLYHSTNTKALAAFGRRIQSGSTIQKRKEKMNIVILDAEAENPGDLSWEGIEKLGNTTIYESTPYDESSIIERLRNADIAVTNKTPLSRTVFENTPSLRYVTVLATGYNVVDTASAAAKGIKVSNVPSYGTDSVAQYAVSLLLELCHHIGHHSDEVHSGRWEKENRWCFWDTPQIELRGKTLGIIGMGRIGRRVGEITSALGMNVIYNSAHRNDDVPYRFVSKDELFRESDVISLHCPLTEKTREIINENTISQMKNGVLIINNSRGGLINEKDLRDALVSGKVKGAAVDVVSTEPITSSNPLLSAPACIITPHISWTAKEARERIMKTTEENIRSFIEGKPQNTVN